MELGVCDASPIGDIDSVVRAEALGYSHAWGVDRQRIGSDGHATLAVAAERRHPCIHAGHNGWGLPEEERVAGDILPPLGSA